jgi:uncharacterized phiE125 gp8 family phage protein
MGTPKPIPKSAPAFQAVTLTQAKEQLKIPQSVSAHDDELNRLILTTIDLLESDTLYASADRTFSWAPVLVESRVPMRHYNATAITTIQYIDSGGNPQTLDAGEYTLDVEKVRPELSLADQSSTWPEVSVSAVTPWTVTYQAGWPDIDSVETWFVEACLAAIDRMWNKEDDEKSAFGFIYDAIERRRYASYI